MMSNDKYDDEKGVHPYMKLINDMMRAIKENNGYIKLGRYKYGPDEELSLSKFIAKVSDNYTVSTAYRFTSTKGMPKPLKPTFSHYQSVQFAHLNVIDSVKFYFKDEEPRQLDESKEGWHRVSKHEVYIDESEPNYKCGCRVLDVYDDLAKNINLAIVNHLKDYEKTIDILKAISANGEIIFKSLYDKIIKYLAGLDEAEHEKLSTKLEQLAAEYKTKFDEERVNTVKPYLRKLLTGAKDFGLLNPNPIDESDINNNLDGKKEENKLSKKRYEQIKKQESDLRDIPIEKWPQYYLELIVLAYLETFFVYSHLISLVKNEVEENIRLLIYYRNVEEDGLLVEEKNFTIKKFSKLLLDYKIRTDLDSLFEFRGGEILAQSVARYPDTDYKFQYVDWQVIDRHITINLRMHLFKKLAHHTNLSIDRRVAEGDLDDYWHN